MVGSPTTIRKVDANSVSLYKNTVPLDIVYSVHIMGFRW